MTDDLSSEAWATSKDTGELFHDTIRILRYDVRGQTHHSPVRYERSAGDRRPFAEVTPTPHRADADGMVHFVDCTSTDRRGVQHQVRPLHERFGTRHVTGLALAPDGAAMVLWACACGNAGRMKAARWRMEASRAPDRGGVDQGCLRCGKRKRHRNFKMFGQRDPLAIVPFHADRAAR